MRLPFGYRIVKESTVAQHLHVTVAVDPATIAAHVREELTKRARRSPQMMRGKRVW